jgi:lipoprotein NlpD
MNPKVRASRSDLVRSDAASVTSLRLADYRWPCRLLAAAAVFLAVGCTTRSLTNAPVVDRGTSARVATTGGTPAPTSPVGSASAKPLPGAENAGKPGFYTVKPGDTLIRIGLDSGQNWRDITRWNSIDNPNLIEVGQVLRVAPPASEPTVRAVASTQPPVSTALPPQDSGARPSPNTANNLPVQPSALPQTQTQAQPSQAGSGGDEELAWIWPVPGTPIAGFDEVKNKGIDIAGRAGEPVLASADGRVVYAGAGLRGYGNLIILKHNNTFLTAYAHNQTLLVKEDQAVRRGQKIAEMGNSDADRVKLHFEIRRQGKPVDPLKYLPPR